MLGVTQLNISRHATKQENTIQNEDKTQSVNACRKDKRYNYC